MRAIAFALATAVATLLTPAVACGAILLKFAGVVSPGSSIYPAFPYPVAGEPVKISLKIEDPWGTPWVSDFSADWSDQPYPYPYGGIASWSDVGLPPGVEYYFGAKSDVSLGSTGGVVHLATTPEYGLYYDGFFGLDVSFSFSQPQYLKSNFLDSHVTGSGLLGSYVNASYGNPGVSDYYSDISFTLTSMSLAQVPEPEAWAMLLVGFAALGCVARGRARQIARRPTWGS